VSGERQLSVKTLELFTESHRAAERDDAELIGRGARLPKCHRTTLTTPDQASEGNGTPVAEWQR
jgi:hypothetical protein